MNKKQLQELEIELALEVAYLSGWNDADAYAESQKQPGKGWAVQATNERAKEFSEEKARANLALMNAVGQAVQANANALEAVSHLVDNLGWRT